MLSLRRRTVFVDESVLVRRQRLDAPYGTLLQDIKLRLVSLYLRRTPWERGRWRLLRWATDSAPRILNNGGACVVRTRHGFKIGIELNEWLGRHVYVSGEYEPPTTHVMKALLQPGDVMIDIGANIGYFTLLASHRVGPAGRVLAFEPVPRTRQCLQDNLQLNNSNNTTVYAEALCNENGTTTFYEGPPEHRGLSSLRPMERAARSLEVRTARLDDLLADRSVGPDLPVGTKVNLIKLDVEGAEYEVVEGMMELLGRDMPDLIIEVTDEYLRGLNRTAKDLSRCLCELGYQMYAIGHDGLVPLTGKAERSAVSGQQSANAVVPSLREGTLASRSEATTDQQSANAADWPKQFNALFTARSVLPASLPLRDSWTG